MNPKISQGQQTVDLPFK